MRETRIYDDPKFFNVEDILEDFTPSDAQQSDEVVWAIISSDQINNVILVLSTLFVENFYLADRIAIDGEFLHHNWGATIFPGIRGSSESFYFSFPGKERSRKWRFRIIEKEEIEKVKEEINKALSFDRRFEITIETG